MTFKNQDFVKDRYSKPMDGLSFQTNRLKKIRDLIPSDSKVLEVGAWDGSTVRFYKEKSNSQFYGLDLDLDIMANAKKDLVDAKACDLNGGTIPWGDNFFDCVVCGEIIEHIFDTDHLLNELKRVLKPGGKLILSTPNLSSFVNRGFILFGLQPLATEVSSRHSHFGNPFRKDRVPAGHIRNFTYRSFKEIVQFHDLEIEAAYSIGFTQKAVFKQLEWLMGALFTSLGSDIILSTRKKK